eukprot:scaffold5155_cov80-Skeletonema_dohrnii-CCMP3373.AAC.1
MLLDLDYCHRSHTMLTRAKAVVVLVILRQEQFFQFSFSTLPITDSINSNSLAYGSLAFIQHRHNINHCRHPPLSTVTASFSSSFAFGSLAISTDGGGNDYHIIPHPTLTAVVRVNNFFFIITHHRRQCCQTTTSPCGSLT